MPGPPTGNAHDLPQHLIRLVVIAALGNSHRSRVETWVQARVTTGRS